METMLGIPLADYGSLPCASQAAPGLGLPCQQVTFEDPRGSDLPARQQIPILRVTHQEHLGLWSQGEDLDFCGS